MIDGRLLTVVGPDIELNIGTFSYYENQHVKLCSLQDRLLISGAGSESPRICLELGHKMLLNFIGKGGSHPVDGIYRYGEEITQEHQGTIDFQVGIDTRDHLDRHILRHVKFKYSEFDLGERNGGFTLLFDIEYGELARGEPRNGCRIYEKYGLSHEGHRVWIRADCRWAQLYDFHAWARTSDLPGEILSKQLGIEIPHQTLSSASA